MRNASLPLVLLLGVIATPAAAKECSVTADEQRDASELDWETFDQAGGQAGSFRDLVSRQCYAEALEAYRLWLNEQGGFPNQRASGIGHFHIGQLLAFLGNYKGAVAMMSKSRRDENVEADAARDWNAYVDGVLGFFNEDGARIQRAKQKLAASNRPFAHRQIRVLEGLRNCVGKPYSVAMSAKCRE